MYIFQVDKILKVIPRERRTFLFSATMTKKVILKVFPYVLVSLAKFTYYTFLIFTIFFFFFFYFQVQKLQRAALKDPVKCAVSTKYSTVDKLQQYYIFIPSKYKVK